MIKIKKIYNNNVALVDCDGVIKIITGNGIAYKKKNGDIVDEKLVREQFVLEKDSQFKSFDDIFNNMSHEVLEAIEKVIVYASSALNTTFNSTTKLAIIDHLYYSIKRYKEGNCMKNTFLWDIKRIYKREYMIAKKCVQIINSSLGINLSEDECSFITLHFINVTYNVDEGNLAVREARAVNDILDIVCEKLEGAIDKDSERYGRFVTHIRYLVRKASKGEKHDKTKNLFLYNYYKKLHKDAYECALAIEKYINEKLNFSVNEDELLYLIVHIVNLIE